MKGGVKEGREGVKRKGRIAEERKKGGSGEDEGLNLLI